MRNLLPLSIVLLLAAFSCTKDFGEELTDAAIATDIMIEVIDKNVFFYDVEAEMWLQPQKHPFHLGNFQKALKEMKNSEEAEIYLDLKKELELKPTHYHVKLYPKNQQQIVSLYYDEDLSVKANSFDTEPVKESVIGKLGLKVPVTKRIPRYIERIDKTGLDPTCGVSIDDIPDTIDMPVFWAVWPVGKPFHPEVDTEIIGEYFLPEAAGEQLGHLDSITIEKIEKRAEENLNISLTASADFMGRVVINDPLIGIIGVKNLDVVLRYGPRERSVMTDTDGYFTFGQTQYPVQYLSFRMLNNEWYFCDPKSKILDIHLEDFPGHNGYYTYTQHNYLSAHRATNDFFHTNYGLPNITHIRPLPITYDVVTTHSSGFTGSRILYYETNATDLRTFSTMSHELGHAAHHKRWYGLGNPQIFIEESLACFYEWRILQNYYSRYGYHEPVEILTFVRNSTPGFCSACDNGLLHSHPDFVYQCPVLDELDRQGWNNTENQNALLYSPLFIDLIDSNNQQEEQWYRKNRRWPYIPYDVISNTPITVVADIALGSLTKEDVYRKLLLHHSAGYINCSRTDLEKFWSYFKDIDWSRRTPVN